MKIIKSSEKFSLLIKGDNETTIEDLSERYYAF